jgi:tripartite-type tricarboxylate transporter receptor subunit TctC
MMRRMLEEAGTTLQMEYVPMSGTSEVVASMRRGEVEATVRSEVAMFKAYQDGVIDILFTFAEETPYLTCGDAPCPAASEALGLPEADFALLSSAARYRRVYVGPPGMADDTVATLRDAFGAVLTSPEFVAASAASNNPVAYIPGADVVAEINLELQLADRYVDYLKETIQ